MLVLPGLAGAFAGAGLVGPGCMGPLPGGLLRQTSLLMTRLFSSSPTMDDVSGLGQISGSGGPQVGGTKGAGRAEG